jgi:hypothetical protein
MNTQPTTGDQLRVARKQELRQKGIPVTKQTFAWRVEPSAIEVPTWLRKHAVKGLPSNENYIWLRRSDARDLARADRAEGGRPMLLRVEYRRCPICKRMLLGELAKARRMLNESCRTGDQLPCGPDCIARHWRGKK